MTDVWTHFRQTLFCSENNIINNFSFSLTSMAGQEIWKKRSMFCSSLIPSSGRCTISKYGGWWRAPARRKVKVKSIPSALANMSHQQNQQNECVPSEDSDQHGHPPSLIKIFAVRSMGSYRLKVSSCGQRRLSDQTGRMPRLIWVIAGRTLTLLVLSCCGSYDLKTVYQIWAAAWQNQQNHMCAQRRLGSARSDQSFCCPHGETLDS